MENKTKEIDYAQIINWALTIILIIALAFAVNQRFLEKNKCEDWARDKIVEVVMNNQRYEVDMNTILAVDQQKKGLADKSANLWSNQDE